MVFTSSDLFFLQGANPASPASLAALAVAAVAVLFIAAGRKQAWFRLAAAGIGIVLAAQGMAGLVLAASPLQGLQTFHCAPIYVALGVTLLGAALACISTHRCFLVGQAIALTSSALGLSSVVSHLYVDRQDLGECSGTFDTILLAVSLGALLVRRDHGIWPLLRSDDLASRLARTLLPLAFLSPLLLDGLGGLVGKATHYDAFTHSVLHATLVTTVSAITVLLSAWWLRRMDAERSDALQQLAATEARLRFQIARMPIGYILWDPLFRVVAWNAAAERVFGFAADEVLGRKIFDDIVPEESRADVEAVWNRLLRGDGDAHSINPNRTKDGRTIICKWSNTPLFNPQGEVGGVISMVEEVTERVTAEHDLRESEERFRDLVDHSNDLICTHDPNGNILTVNPTVERSLGYTKEELLRMNIRDVLAPDARAEFDAYLATLIAKDRASGTMRVVTKSGAQRLWQYENTVRRRDGMPLLVRGMARDITQERTAERELRKSEERYRMLFEHGPQPTIVVFDDTDAVAAANGAALRQFGVSRAEFQDKNVYELLIPEEQEGIRRARTRPDETRVFSGVRFQRNDGSIFSADVVSTAIVYENRAARLVVIADVTDRVAAKAELREAKQFNENIISNAGQGIVAFDRELNVLVWNRFMEQQTATSEPEIIGRNASTVRPFTNERVLRALRLTLETGQQQVVEFALTLGAEERWLMQVSVAHRNPHGSIVGVIAIISDITLLKRTEESLHKSRELFRSIIEVTPSYIFTLDLDHRFMTANPAVCSALGIPEAQITGRRISEFELFEGAPGEWEALCAHVRTTKMATNFQSASPLADGRTLIHEGTVSPLLDGSGIVTGFSCLSRDVTERRRTGELLHRLSQAVEQASEVIFMTDRDGTFVYTNPAFESIYGYSPAETEGKTPRILKSGQYSDQTYAEFWATILSGRGVTGEVINKRKDGSLVTVARSVTPIFGDEGEITGFLSVQTDVTERQKVEAQREELQRRMTSLAKMEAIGTLAGGIAHDFNNILAGILSFTTVAERSRTNDKKFAFALESIRKAIGRGADLSKQVLTFARRAETVVSAIEVNAIITEVTKMAHQTFPRTIAIECDLGEELPLIIADESQLHQGLLNLCINARDAMPAGGTLRITTRVIAGVEVRRRFPEARDGSYLGIVVSDTGIGMSEEVRQRIFEPFFTTKMDRGTGLGLAVTYGAVNTAGGFIGVDSTIGYGTTFLIALPVADTPPAATVPPSAGTVVRGGSETILLVEDEEAIAELMSEELRAHGYEVVLAHDGFAALESFKAHEERIDLVISDDGLPHMAGRDLFVVLRARMPRLPFILASGFVDAESMETLHRLGVNRFLQKPYTIDDLLIAARTVLDGASVLA